MPTALSQSNSFVYLYDEFTFQYSECGYMLSSLVDTGQIHEVNKCICPGVLTEVLKGPYI